MYVDSKTGISWSAENLKRKDHVLGDSIPLTDEWLANQKPLGNALDEMLDIIGPINQKIIGGHNILFDDDVMKRALVAAGLNQCT